MKKKKENADERDNIEECEGKSCIKENRKKGGGSYFLPCFKAPCTKQASSCRKWTH